MANSFDIEIGRRIRTLRLAANVSAKKMATALAVAVPDYEAAEAGRARFSAGQLIDLARMLGVPLSALLNPMEQGSASLYSLVTMPRRLLRAH